MQHLSSQSASRKRRLEEEEVVVLMMEDLWLWLSGLLAALVILFYTSTTVNFLFKFLYLYVAYMSMGLLISIICLPRPRDPSNGVFAAKLMCKINRLVGVEWEIIGKEKLLVDEGAVLVLNHQSAIDLLGIMEMWPILGRAAPVAKKSLMYMGPFGLAAWLVGVVFIDRTSTTSRADVNKAGREAKLSRTKLILFPEGTRNHAKGLSMLPFKKGAFHVALDGEMRILPAVIAEYDFLDSNRMVFRPGKARIKVLDPIDTSVYTKESVNELVEVTRGRMLEALKEISTPSHSSHPTH